MAVCTSLSDHTTSTACPCPHAITRHRLNLHLNLHLTNCVLPERAEQLLLTRIRAAYLRRQSTRTQLMLCGGVHWTHRIETPRDSPWLHTAFLKSLQRRLALQAVDAVQATRERAVARTGGICPIANH